MTQRWIGRQPQMRLGASPATTGLLAAMLVVFIAATASAQVAGALYTGSWSGYAWQLWRPLAYGLTTSGILGLVINGLALFFMGRGLEQTVGTANFLVLYLLSGFGAATVLVLAGPLAAFGGSFAGIMGIIAAYAVFKHQAHLDIRGDIALMALLVIMSFLGNGGLLGGSASLHGDWLGDLGALAVGAGAGAVYAYSPWRDRRRRLVVGYLALAVVCLAALAVKWALNP